MPSRDPLPVLSSDATTKQSPGGQTEPGSRANSIRHRRRFPDAYDLISTCGASGVGAVDVGVVSPSAHLSLPTLESRRLGRRRQTGCRGCLGTRFAPAFEPKKGSRRWTNQTCPEGTGEDARAAVLLCRHWSTVVISIRHRGQRGGVFLVSRKSSPPGLTKGCGQVEAVNTATASTDSGSLEWGPSRAERSSARRSSRWNGSAARLCPPRTAHPPPPGPGWQPPWMRLSRCCRRDEMEAAKPSPGVTPRDSIP